MEFKKIIDDRKSTRSFKNKKIRLSVLKQLITDGTKAPSNNNVQPWFFYIINKKDQLDYIKKTIRDKKKIIDKNHFYYNLGNTQAIIFICINKKDLESNDQKNSYLLSIGASIENILLSAQNKGISSCWIGHFENYRSKFKGKIKIDSKHAIVAGITLGYSNEKISIKTSRKKIEDVSSFL
jgi:nitroreductase